MKHGFRLKGNLISLTSDDFYWRYIQYLLLLLSNTLTWVFALVSIYFHALPLNLQNPCSTYISFKKNSVSHNITNVAGTCCAYTQRSHRRSEAYYKILLSYLNYCSHSNFVSSNLSQSYCSNSQTETTIEEQTNIFNPLTHPNL